MRSLLIAPFFILGMTCCGIGHAETVAEKAARDGTLNIASDDPQMQAAFDQAQKTLPEFVEALDNRKPGTSGFTVKIPVTDRGYTEYFWINELSHKGSKFTGRLNNRPETVRNVEFGQEMTFPKSRIRDWGYVLDGRLQGNFTTCVLLGREDAAQAQELKDQIGLTCK